MQSKPAATCISCGKMVDQAGVFCSECSAKISDPRFVPTSRDNDSTNESIPGTTAQQDGHADLIGYVLENRYRLQGELGRGGMGVVFRATRLLIGDEVAVKILNPDRLADPNAASRFRREAQAAARLKHPNVVSVYDFGVNSDGLFYLVTELADGQSLRQMLTERKTLSVAVAIEIIAQVCAALDEAHKREIVHRDIKPDNIVVNETSNGWRVKVLDFGIAKLRDLGTENLTQTSNLMGTPHYMSPEQCLGEELDARADVYSLGVVLYELLCGGVPFDSPIAMAVVVQHVNQAPPSLRAINASIPAAVEAVIMRALAKQREARPQSAGALSRELVAALRENGQFQAAGARSASSTVAYPRLPNDTPGYTPTMVMPAARRAQPNVAGGQPVKNNSSMVLLFVAVLLAIVAGSALTYYIVSEDKAESKDSATTTATPKKETRTSGTAPASTSVKPPPSVAQSAPTNRPAYAKRFAVSQYTGVNIRAEPSRDSLLLTTIGKDQGVWVLEESPNYDTFTIKSEERDVTDNWSRIELVDNSSVRGWVFSGFLSKE